MQEDTNMVVAVNACLLMVEAQSMQELVLYCPIIDAALAAQRHHLATTNAPHIGITPVKKKNQEVTHF